MVRRRDPMQVERMRQQMQRLSDEMNAERPMRGEPGEDGEDGQPIELTEAGDWLQYRVRGAAAWTPLINLEVLRVYPDPVALQSFVNNWLVAHPVEPGKSVELQASATHIQWRQTGGAWADLLPLVAIKGADSTVPGPANALSIGTVTTGAAGSAAAAAITGTPPAQSLSLTIPRGNTGNTGPSAKVALGTLTVAQTATVAINAGVRTLSFTGVTGALAGDDLLLFPTSALPAGYAIHNVRCPVAGTVEVTLTAPLLAIGASFSIPCRLVALR